MIAGAKPLAGRRPPRSDVPSHHNFPWKLFLDVILRPSFSLGLADAEGPQAVSASVLP